jgi:Uma2 family endonuclease
MSAGASIPVEEYLSTSYSPDCHFVEGLLVERNGGEKEHGRMQRALIRYLARYRDSGIEAWPEQRLNIRDNHYRVCDVCVTEGEPEAQIFSGALVCFEILSRKDTLHQLQEVIDDYLAIGVPHCWIIDPWKRVAYVALPRGFERLADGVFRTSPPYPELVVPLDELYNL